MSEANKNDALKAMVIGERALKEGNKAKAIKFLEKSVRMYPTPQAHELLRKAQSDENTASSTNSGGGSGAGLWHRTNAKKPVPSRTEPVKDTRPFTKEQADAVNKVKGCKDLYQMLGVPRDAEGPAIKKAYRKMAIKLHPDKNSAPGADEAFKEINKAFSILSDPEKRQQYDHFGETSDNPAQQFTRRYYQDGEFDPSDIFREVFGAGFAPMGGNVRMYRFGGGQGGSPFFQQGPRAQQMERQASLLQLLPLLLLFIMSFVSLPGQEDIAFSLQKTHRYPVLRKTMTKNIVPDIPFFVDKNFKRVYGRDYNKLRQVEVQVQRNYFTLIENKCRTDRIHQRRRMQRATQAGDRETAQKLLEYESESCKEWDRINAHIRT